MSKWPFQQIEPQSAKGAFKAQYLSHPDWVSEEKYDGDRRIAQFCGDVVRFTGKRPSVKDGKFVEKTDNIPHLSHSTVPISGSTRLGLDAKLAKHVEGLTGTVLDGEMISKAPGMVGGKSKYATKVMGSLPEEAVEKQWESGWLHYVVFDCLFYKGQDQRGLPYTLRREQARKAVELWGNFYTTLAEQSGEIDVGYTPKRHVEDILKRGGEGIILKHKDAVYGHDRWWVKKKFEATYDCVVMGYEDAKAESKKVDGTKSATKYALKGWIGAIRIGQFFPIEPGLKSLELRECGTISGMDDELREELTLHGKKYVGKVVEVKANGREPTGRFRHPRFCGWRPDKDPKKCVYRKEES